MNHETARVKAIEGAKEICKVAGIDFASDDGTRILDILERERKLQDRDTRHACAEAVADLSEDPAYAACINAKAV